MNVTYLDHSGFCVELKHTVLIFDFVEGSLLHFDPKKAIYFFVSHRHQDHFHKHLGELLKAYPQAKAIVSSDIRRVRDAAVTFMRPKEERMLDDIYITTLQSTDEGVAFLVQAEQQVIYHAGDLHWWYWDDDSKSEKAAMKQAYFTEIKKLCDIPIDLAFLVLDPRQESDYWMGFDAFMRINQVQYAVPMHCWGDYDIMNRLKNHPCSEPYRDRIISYDHRGETFQIGGKQDEICI